MPKDNLFEKCNDCLDRNFAFERVLSAGLYDNALRETIMKLKYGNAPYLAKPLSQFMINSMQRQFNSLEMPVSIVPVPLHRSKQAERGYNQALELSRPIAAYLECEILTGVLTKVRKTKSQAGLSHEKRIKNVVDAFRIEDVDAIIGKSIILIDDVVTTTETANECARTLINGGAKKVTVVCTARSNH